MTLRLALFSVGLLPVIPGCGAVTWDSPLGPGTYTGVMTVAATLFGESVTTASPSFTITIGPNGLPEIVTGREVFVGQDTGEGFVDLLGDALPASGTELTIESEITEINVSTNALTVVQEAGMMIRLECDPVSVSCNSQATYIQRSQDSIEYTAIQECTITTGGDSGLMTYESSGTLSK